ncbi:MAG: 4-hydroxy-tetrahydrodipicolinate reductase [Synergistaceae bacterium]|nr:4-hydroxy-tetrahydrodipicolinate reductase [Synergistaceae bacterium]
MKIIITGATGRMGQKMQEASRETGTEVAALISPDFTKTEGLNYQYINEFTGTADCVVDFSNHLGTVELLDWCVKKNVPVVIATTGHSEEEKKAIEQASSKIAVFYSGNMSLGIATLCNVARRVASAFPNADIEIIEVHHNKKLDAPSGTALMLGNALKDVRPNAEFVVGRSGNCPRQKNEIGIQSIRMGNIVGIHEIMISTGSETITLKHEAHDRKLFADGAIEAAKFLIDKPAGLYSISQLVKN